MSREKTEASGWLKPTLKAALLVVFMLAAIGLISFSPLQGYLRNLRAIDVQLDRMGIIAPAVFTLAVTGLVALGCPRLLLCPVGGMAFGFFWGLLWTQVGTLLGAYLMFLFVRWGGRELILRHWPKLGRLSAFIEQRGLLSVILVRQLPIGGIVLNFVLGLSPVRHGHFLLGTLLGNLPEAIPGTLIGSGAMSANTRQGAWQMGLAIALLIAVWLGMSAYMHFSRRAAQVRSGLENAVATKEQP